MVFCIQLLSPATLSFPITSCSSSHRQALSMTSSATLHGSLLPVKLRTSPYPDIWILPKLSLTVFPALESFTSLDFHFPYFLWTQTIQKFPLIKPSSVLFLVLFWSHEGHLYLLKCYFYFKAHQTTCFSEPSLKQQWSIHSFTPKIFSVHHRVPIPMLRTGDTACTKRNMTHTLMGFTV